MRLMFENAWAYNRKTTKIYKFCSKVSDVDGIFKRQNKKRRPGWRYSNIYRLYIEKTIPKTVKSENKIVKCFHQHVE